MSRWFHPSTILRRRWAVPAVVLLCALPTAWVSRDRPVPRSSGRFPHQAYVWQREWTPAVGDAVSKHAESFNRLIVLSAELTWKAGRPTIARAAIDYTALRASGVSVGFALRVGAYRGPFDPAHDDTRRLVSLARKIVDNARSSGIEPAELQIDFDCAESRLGGYARWLSAVRTEIPDVPLTFTALPAWLDHDDFGRLIGQADGYVLQIHSLRRPESVDAPMTLCDPVAGQAAVERAARWDKPFWVALPTYGYRVAFDSAGHYRGISAENNEPDWGPGTVVRDLRADPAEMATLVQRWAADRPAHLQGVIWYRLPIATDRLNWRWPTLQSVMHGNIPAGRLHVDTAIRGDIVDMTLINSGDADFEWKSLRITAEPTNCESLDGFSGFAAEISDDCPTWSARAGRMSVGESRPIGWFRGNIDREVHVHVEME